MLGRLVEVLLAEDGAQFSDLAQPLLVKPPGHLRPGEEFSFERYGYGSYVGAIGVKYEAWLDIAAQLLDVLPEEWKHLRPDDLCDYLWSCVTDVLEGTFDGQPNDLRDRLEVKLGSKLERWDFDVRVAGNEYVFGGGRVGAVSNGPHPFVFFVTDTDEDSVTDADPLVLYASNKDITELDWNPDRNAYLSGTVFAPTETAALTAVESVVLSVLGAGWAVGLFRRARHVDPASGLITRGAPTRETISMPLTLNGEAVSLTFATSRILWDCVASVPGDLSDIERAALGEHRVLDAIDRHLRLVRKVMTAAGDRADAVRAACRTAMAAVSTRDYGLAVTLAFSVVEGLLLEADHKDNVLARLTEAVAH